MFTAHFKMTRHPFSENTSVDCLLHDDRVAQGLARLQYLVQAGTMGLLIGATGVGKSSLLKLFLGGLNPNQIQTVYVHLTRLESTAFLKLLLTQMGEVPKTGKGRVLQQIVAKAQTTELPTLLIIDEAHLLEEGALTDLRLLVSSALQDAPPIKILLSAQEQIREPLKRASCAALVHRITVRYHMPAMTADQTAAYLDFHVKQAGGPDKLFEPEVKSLIHDHTRGVPRQINNLATACLIQAAAEKSQRIGESVFQVALSEFQLP